VSAPRIRTVIVEDERRARENLRDALAEVAWIEIVGEAGDGDAALRLIEDAAPDLAFIDVQLPKRSGVDVLRALSSPPHVIFTTAYDAFAVTAFELGAIDYLQKPFGRARLSRALERVKPLLDGPAHWPQERLEALNLKGAVRRLFVRDGARITSAPMDEIESIESEGDYARIFTADRQLFVRSSLREIEARLDPGRFVRAHRSRLVNAGHVRKLTPLAGGRFTVWLTSGRTLTTSREGARALRALVIG
jgi:two-component system LytT family response regulator